METQKTSESLKRLEENSHNSSQTYANEILLNDFVFLFFQLYFDVYQWHIFPLKIVLKETNSNKLAWKDKLRHMIRCETGETKIIKNSTDISNEFFLQHFLNITKFLQMIHSKIGKTFHWRSSKSRRNFTHQIFYFQERMRNLISFPHVEK